MHAEENTHRDDCIHTDLQQVPMMPNCLTPLPESFLFPTVLEDNFTTTLSKPPPVSLNQPKTFFLFL